MSDEGSPEVVTLYLIEPAARALDEASRLSGADQATIINRALQMYAYLLFERSIGHHIALLERASDRINIYEVRFNDDPDFVEFTMMAREQRAEQKKKSEFKLWQRILHVLGWWP